MPTNTMSDAASLDGPLIGGPDVRALADAAQRIEAAQRDVLELFDECAPGLRRYVRSCGLTPETAEDVVQESFLALFAHLRVGGARQNLRGWLYKVSYRKALKQRERLQRWRRHEVPWDTRFPEIVADPAANPESQTVGRERRRRLQAVVQALPERDRRCLFLRAEGLRYREIATTLGISLGAVAGSLARAVARLSNAVKGQSHAPLREHGDGTARPGWQ